MTISAVLDVARTIRDARAWHAPHARLLLRDALGVGRATDVRSDDECLAAAAQWLALAQDAMPDGGIAGRYRLDGGWTSSYPETTGYLIPTLLQIAKEPGMGAYEERAARAVEFLLDCQLPNGAFPGGEIDQNRAQPSVFNSAQIIHGLVAWHRQSKDQRALDAAVRAGAWLVARQDPDGAWRRHVYEDTVAAYHAHASCWLAELGVHVGEKQYIEAARRHRDWVLSAADETTGWIDGAGFTKVAQEARVAFTHTIAYTHVGVMLSADFLGEATGLEIVQRAAAGMAQTLEVLHWLPGVLDWRWRKRGEFACVTGTAQMALLWMRLFDRSGDLRLLNAALRAIDTVKQAQVGRAVIPALTGAIPGSDPLWGAYIPLAFPNWAAKFFIDALFAKRQAIARLDTLPPVPWTPPVQLMQTRPEPRPAVRTGSRVVLYTSPHSRKVEQMLTAWGPWGFRPDAVIIEWRPTALPGRRLRDRLRNACDQDTPDASRRRALDGTGAASPDGNGGDPARLCERLGIPVVRVRSLSDSAGIEAVRALNPDIAVHAGVGILSDGILRVPAYGTLHAHMALLPRYRGVNVAEWSALEGGLLGCSVHLIDEGIDTGPVLAVQVLDGVHARSIEELRALIHREQIALLGEVLRLLLTRGREAVTPYRQAPEEGRQYFRMHAVLRAKLTALLQQVPEARGSLVQCL